MAQPSPLNSTAKALTSKPRNSKWCFDTVVAQSVEFRGLLFSAFAVECNFCNAKRSCAWAAALKLKRANKEGGNNTDDKGAASWGLPLEEVLIVWGGRTVPGWLAYREVLPLGFRGATRFSPLSCIQFYIDSWLRELILVWIRNNLDCTQLCIRTNEKYDNDIIRR